MRLFAAFAPFSTDSENSRSFKDLQRFIAIGKWYKFSIKRPYEPSSGGYENDFG